MCLTAVSLPNESVHVPSLFHGIHKLQHIQLKCFLINTNVTLKKKKHLQFLGILSNTDYKSEASEKPLELSINTLFFPSDCYRGFVTLCDNNNAHEDQQETGQERVLAAEYGASYRIHPTWHASEMNNRDDRVVKTTHTYSTELLLAQKEQIL